MPKYDTPLLVKQIAGYAGRAPEVKDGKKGEFVSFTVAVTRSYDRDDDDPTVWYRIGVNDQQVQDFVMANVKKGTPVVIEGSEYESEYQGTTQFNMNAFRVGIVDWFIKGSKPKSRAQEDEDL